MLRADGYLGYFLAAAFLLSPLDKVSVSLVNFSELTELLENLVKWILIGNLTFISLYIFIKTLGGLKLYLQMT